MKFELETAEIVDGDLHLVISNDRGDRVEQYCPLGRAIYGKDDEDLERKWTEELTSHASRLMNWLLPRSRDLPELIRPRILVALREKGYDVE